MSFQIRELEGFVCASGERTGELTIGPVSIASRNICGVHVQIFLVRRMSFLVSCQISLAADPLAANVAVNGSLDKVDWSRAPAMYITEDILWLDVGTC